ncbi:MAG: beta family protein [Pseudomonadota bacterium]
MNLHYVPVMAAKRGEFTALSKLSGSTPNRMVPLFELPTTKSKSIEKAISRTASDAGKAWQERMAFLDISKWSPNARTESGVHVLEYALNQFRSNNIETHPVVRYDRWDDPTYSQALKNICSYFPVTPCIRLDRETIQDDMPDSMYFSDRIQEILESLDLESGNCYAMIDFGDVSTTSVPQVIADMEMAIGTLRDIGFGELIVVGGSMPTAVNVAVDTPDAVGCIPRIEMLAWKAVFSDWADENIIFGDYLIRSPIATEGVIALHANAKIRYTIDNQYFIVRGHSKQQDSLATQHKELAKKLVASPHYMGSSFSWGDSTIFNCSIGATEIRDATLMIAIDSSHHICSVIAEIFEHKNQIVSSNNSSHVKSQKEDL